MLRLHSLWQVMRYHLPSARKRLPHVPCSALLCYWHAILVVIFSSEWLLKLNCWVRLDCSILGNLKKSHFVFCKGPLKKYSTIWLWVHMKGYIQTQQKVKGHAMIKHFESHKQIQIQIPKNYCKGNTRVIEIKICFFNFLSQSSKQKITFNFLYVIIYLFGQSRWKVEKVTFNLNCPCSIARKVLHMISITHKHNCSKRVTSIVIGFNFQEHFLQGLSCFHTIILH